MLISQSELKKRGIETELVDLEKNLIQLGHEVEGVTSFKNDKLVVGHVVSKKPHPSADKLNLLEVDIKSEILSIVCGAPNVDVDQYVIVAVNGCILGELEIKPVQIRSQESNGMICSLAELGINKNLLSDEDVDGIFVFDEPVEIGTNALVALGLDDNILDLSLTANRGDCLSYLGVSRDLLALSNRKLAIDVSDYTGYSNNNVSVFIEDNSATKLMSIVVNNIKVTKSMNWLKMWLIKNNIKPQNNIVDLANYTMYQIGLPVHTYDASKVIGSITCSVLKDEEKFVALDEQEYVLKPGSIVIKDEQKVISLASVMGSNDTKVVEDTTDIIIEIGCFDPQLVRKTANILGRKTDASIRGEKNVDIAQMDNVAIYLTKLIKSLNNDVVISKKNEVTTLKEDVKQIVTLKYADVSSILGIDVDKDRIVSILNNLGFKGNSFDDNSISVIVPTWRMDIDNDHDLIEEIIRIISMDLVEIDDVNNTFIRREKIIKTKKIAIERNLEKVVLDAGLDQVITYSLVSLEDLSTFNQEVDKSVELMMPLSNEHRYYRQSLIPSLIKTAKYNLDRQQNSSAIFEIANTYKLIDKEIIESYKVSGLVCGQKEAHYDGIKTNYDFYDLKFVVEQILNSFRIEFTIENCQDKIDQLNPYVSADIIVDGMVIGFIGQKHPNYIKKIKYPVYVFELDLQMIEQKIKPLKTYKKISTNPRIVRDLTVTTPIDTHYTTISSVFDGINYLESFECNYIYTGDKIKEGTKAVTFSVTFGDDNQTLTGDMIDNEVQTIIMNIKNLNFEFKEQ